MKGFFILLFLIHSIVIGFAQPSKDLPVSAQSTFQDGIYGHFKELKSNRPGRDLRSLPMLDYQLDADSNQVYLSPTAMQALPLDSIWGICIKGVPYYKLAIQEGNQLKTHFIRLYVVGKIGYFYYKTFAKKTIQMNVYHPFTGKLMGSKDVVNRELVLVEKMLRWDTGETTDFNLANFRQWIADDSKLSKSFAEMPETEAASKIFKTLLIYNDRNPVQFDK